MANNLDVLDGAGVSKTVKTTDNTGVHTPHHNVDASALPDGAATAAKQPALGTAGAASADVLSVQGVASMTPLQVAIASGATAGTEYTEDAASAADPVGGMLMARRRDTLVTNEVSATGDNIALNATSKGELHVKHADQIVLAAGGNKIGTVDLSPSSSAFGLEVARVISAASTNATSVKASVGRVFGWYIDNANAARRYLKLYDKASAPTVGTDTPRMTIPIPPGSAANVEFTNGITFATGIALAITTGVADADTGAVAADEIVVNLLYK